MEQICQEKLSLCKEFSLRDLRGAKKLIMDIVVISQYLLEGKGKDCKIQIMEQCTIPPIGFSHLRVFRGYDYLDAVPDLFILQT